MNTVMRKLIDTLDYSNVQQHPTAEISNTIPRQERTSISQEITHAWWWPRVGQWLKDGDVIVTETGTANFGILETRFPPNVTHISQVLWGSIGYSVGAAQGAALAVKETAPGRRVILFVGDGSLQLTAQEISTMIRHGLKPIIFVINNNGYTIERLIHGMKAVYNDVHPWKYTQLLETFGANAKESAVYQLKTKTDVEQLFRKEEFSSAPCIQVCDSLYGQ